VLVEQVDHPYQIRKKYQKRQKRSHFVVITRVKTDEKAKREKSFAGIEGARLRFDTYFVTGQVLSGFDTVLHVGVEFIERDEACDW